MTFSSILFDETHHEEEALLDRAPACFSDLNLDQLIDRIAAPYKEYDLEQNQGSYTQRRFQE